MSVVKVGAQDLRVSEPKGGDDERRGEEIERGVRWEPGGRSQEPRKKDRDRGEEEKAKGADDGWFEGASVQGRRAVNV